jgi:hypothetical protein
VEVLLSIFWELLEEERKKSVDVFSSCDSVADRATAVRVADVDRLVKEDDGCVCVPGVWVVVKLDLLVDGRGTEFEEKAS